MAGVGPFERQPRIAAGVSGGPDSMALALLLRDWVAARRGSLLAVVVDHRLRPNSTAEAALVVARLAELGIPAQIATRDGPMPKSGLQATARAARYALLEEAAAAAGILHLAIAHHAADQRETVALRLAAGSGTRGAAGMSAVRELDRVRLIRPLLGVEPESLQALLRSRGVPWLADPGNRDPRFWRARHRAERLAVPSPARPAESAASRETLDGAVAAWLAHHARPHPLGFITVPSEPLAALDVALLEPLLARLVLATSGDHWPPGRAKLQRLATWLRHDTGRRTALGGVLIERAGPDLRFVREPRAVAGTVQLPATGLFWDGRFRIVCRTPATGLQVAPAGPGWRARLGRCDAPCVYHDEPSALPALVFDTLPLVSAGSLALAIGPWCLERAGAGLDIRFRPRNRYAALPFARSVSPSVVSPRECLMYGNACGEAPGT